MTFNEARDAILAVFKTAWDTTGYPVVWTDVAGSVPNTETVWARVKLQHASGGQSSLAGENGARRWARGGTVHVQVFAPVGDGSSAAYDAAQLVVDAFQQSQHANVWFKDARVREAPDDGAFSQLNVQVTFSYDDVR